MNRQSRQRGFVGVLSFLIALSFLSLLFLEFATAKTREQKLSQAAPFYDRMKHAVQQINAYQMDKVAGGNYTINDLGIFPTHWRDLEPVYLTPCSGSEQSNGYCLPHNKTPWDTDMTMEVSYVVGEIALPQLTITIPMQPNSTEFALERDAYIGALGKLPGARMDEAQNAVLLVVSRLDNAIQHDGVVKRSGNNSTLTGDWDVGGEFAITNTKDVLVRNSDGTQRNLATAVIETFVSKHGDRVDKPKCPTHLKPDIQVAIKGIFPHSKPNQFNEVSMQKAYTTEYASHWTIGLDYYAINKISKEWVFMHDGEVSVSLRCIYH
ncbi:hypothetical protein TUM4438_40410 [Shewanella sairae]|uniref:Type II secretion system protein n=1 Tax=Shewanella sairae TaxID=190310 RepID=A0ABQ4PQC5_9GAMM|nr:hypothetical protein [Shewanella sairae]MCL1132245.1 hypothetical protein [Shewanella sairae]GIU51294.1 hypothetical protein TUM4438_40410 [Shewanella sairae]